MNIILSIKPEWAKLIYEGKKTIEWRKNIPKIDNPVFVFIYETAPIQKITGFFTTNETFLQIHDPIKNDIGIILRGCVERKELKKYQGNSKFLYGWDIIDPHKLNLPKKLKEFGLNRPPQSWCYTKRKLTTCKRYLEDKENT